MQAFASLSAILAIIYTQAPSLGNPLSSPSLALHIRRFQRHPKERNDKSKCR